MSTNPDLEPLYAALKKADAAGDTEGAKKLAGYIRTKSSETPAKSSTPPKAEEKPKERSVLDTLTEGAKIYGEAVAGPVEAGESILTGAVATPIAGVAGLAQGAYNKLTGSTDTSAADRVSQVQSGLTYTPRTELGRETVGAASAPFEALAKAGDWAGQKTSDITGSPLAGAVVNTALQAAPSAILPELAGKGPLGARIAARRQPVARVEPTIGEPAPAGAPQVSGTPPARPPGTGPDQVPFTADPNAPAAPKQPLQTPARQTAEQRAQAYVRDRAGVAWDSLSQGIRDQITKIAQDPGSLEKLDPTVVARKARLEAAQLPATRGQTERSLSQLTKEDSLTKSNVGKDIQDIKSRQDSRLHQLVDAVKRDTGAVAETREQAGKSVQDAGLRAKLRSSKANYDKLYKKARETEPEATVPPDPMYNFVRGNPEVLNPSIQHLGWLQTWLKKAGIESEGEVATPGGTRRDSLGMEIETPGGTSSQTQRRPLKLTELDDLRKKALSIAKGGGDSAHYAGEVIKAIDESFEKVPAAAKAWKEAREAFKAHKTEFDEQGIIKKLATDKSRTDRRAALEKTLDTVLGSSSEDIGRLKASLTEGHFNPESEAAGAQAWKDVQGGVVEKLKEAAQGKREIGNEQGIKQFNSSFRDLFNKLDKDGKIDAIFSPEQAKRLRDINQLVEDVRTTPSGRVAGSDTVPKLISMLDKVADLPGADLLSKVPGVGPIGHAIVKGVKKVHEAGEEGRAARKAKSDPLEEAVKGAKTSIRRRQNKAAAVTAAPAFTIGEQLQRDQQQ